MRRREDTDRHSLLYLDAVWFPPRYISLEMILASYFFRGLKVVSLGGAANKAPKFYDGPPRSEP